MLMTIFDNTALPCGACTVPEVDVMMIYVYTWWTLPFVTILLVVMKRMIMRSSVLSSSPSAVNDHEKKDGKEIWAFVITVNYRACPSVTGNQYDKLVSNL
jgi:hypothetical protein